MNCDNWVLPLINSAFNSRWERRHWLCLADKRRWALTVLCPNTSPSSDDRPFTEIFVGFLWSCYDDFVASKTECKERDHGMWDHHSLRASERKLHNRNELATVTLSFATNFKGFLLCHSEIGEWYCWRQCYSFFVSKGMEMELESFHSVPKFCDARSFGSERLLHRACPSDCVAASVRS